MLSISHPLYRAIQFMSALLVLAVEFSGLRGRNYTYRAPFLIRRGRGVWKLGGCLVEGGVLIWFIRCFNIRPLEQKIIATKICHSSLRPVHLEFKNCSPPRGDNADGDVASTSCVGDTQHYVFDFCSHISKASDMFFDCCFEMSVQ